MKLVYFNPHKRSRAEELEALAYVRRIKRFYESLMVFLVIAPVFLVAFHGQWPVYLMTAGTGIAIAIQGLMAHEVIRFLSPGWERRLVEKRLGYRL